MAEEYIARTLWYLKDGETTYLSQHQLADRTEPLVILGEAGMGKTSLLKQLADDSGYVFCTANQLINHPKPHKLFGEFQVLVIDALDEVSSSQAGDALNSLLGKLCDLDCPRFVLSCRVSDWRSATGVTTIRELCAIEPLELHLDPFGRADIEAYLSERFGYEQANQVIDHFQARGLTELLGNPQTLGMIARVVQGGNLPDTRSELFAQAVTQLYTEHNELKTVDLQLPKDVALDAAGAACAALILTGCEVISRKAAANLAKEELSLAEVAQLGGVGEIATVLSSRLFKAQGSDRFSYIHRRVGEYLGACWLAKQADTARKKKRLLGLFHHNGLVPASLRGLHAWLALDSSLFAAVIAADPMGVIEYGDADTLSPSDARALLQILSALLKNNPEAISWGKHGVRSLAHPELVDDLKLLMTAPETEYRLRLLILDSLTGSAIAEKYTDELRIILLDTNADFIVRKAAGNALTKWQDAQQWTDILVTLNNNQQADSIRLAVELLDDIGYEKINDLLISDLAISYIQKDGNTIGILMELEQNLPEQRLAGVLNCLADKVHSYDKQALEPRNSALNDFTNHLIIRALKTDRVTAKQLWSWLEPLAPYAGYQIELKQQLCSIISGDDELRRQVQRLVLLDSINEHNVYLRMHYLRERSSGFIPTNQDVIALLAALDPTNHNDDRWQQVVRLVGHDDENGAEVRAAAHHFAEHSPKLMEWLEQLTSPIVLANVAEQDEMKRARLERLAQKLAEQREHYTSHIQRMSEGDHGVLIDPAKAYLRLFTDMPKGVPAHQRLEQWLGIEIAEAAHLGFDIFLMKASTQPTAQQVAISLAENKYYQSSYIVVAALAERIRKNIGFDDVPYDQLMVGIFELMSKELETHAGIEGLKEAIEQALKVQGHWERAIRIFYESQFSVGKEHISFHGFMTNENESALATRLAAEWLEKFPELTIQTEKKLINRLIRSEKFGELSRIANSRLGLIDVERQNTWDAIGVFINFEQTVKRLETSGTKPELLWCIRDISRNNRHQDASQISMAISATLLEWVISKFRMEWSVAPRPNGVTVGRRNIWNASSYITDLIYQLGSNVSQAAGEALNRLQSDKPDGYTECIKTAIAERTRQLVEAAYMPPDLSVIKAVLTDSPPASNRDLLAFMLEELAVVQAKIKSDDAKSWQGFFGDAGVAHVENRCRDHLLALLRQGEKDISYKPEGHAADDKKVDITCSVGALCLPIEIKGQWHEKLWMAADDQLARLYTPDWQAGGLGIYLVLWCGEQSGTKALKGQSGRKPKPNTPEELRAQLTAASVDAREGRVEVVVLDLARP